MCVSIAACVKQTLHASAESQQQNICLHYRGIDTLGLKVCLRHVVNVAINSWLKIFRSMQTGAVSVPRACTGALLQGVSGDSAPDHHGSL